MSFWLEKVKINIDSIKMWFGNVADKTSAAKPDPLFWVQSDFWPNFRVQTGRVGRPSGSQNVSNQVGLTSKRVQIRVQPYNVLNKPD